MCGARILRTALYIANYCKKSLKYPDVHMHRRFSELFRFVELNNFSHQLLLQDRMRRSSILCSYFHVTVFPFPTYHRQKEIGGTVH
jgi:hypothetical protein